MTSRTRSALRGLRRCHCCHPGQRACYDCKTLKMSGLVGRQSGPDSQVMPAVCRIRIGAGGRDGKNDTSLWLPRDVVIVVVIGVCWAAM